MLCLQQTDLALYYKLGSLDNYCYYCYHALKSTIDPEREFVIGKYTHLTTRIEKASKIVMCHKCERLLYEVRLARFCERCAILSRVFIDKVDINH